MPVLKKNYESFVKTLVCPCVGMRKETEDLVRERERIKQEKEELLRQSQFNSLPKPVPLTVRLGPKVTGEEGEPATTTTTTTTVQRPAMQETEGKWSDALDSMLEAVGTSGAGGGGKSHKASLPKAGSILPGASSFEDIEAYLDAEKKRKKHQMKERNKGFVKPRQQW